MCAWHTKLCLIIQLAYFKFEIVQINLPLLKFEIAYLVLSVFMAINFETRLIDFE